MNCINCGARIDNESKTCPKCGKHLQIVPDYNLFDDDINILIDEPETKKETPRTSKSPTVSKKKKKADTKKKIQLLIVLLSVVTICLLLFLSFFAISDWMKENNASSYNYQINQAEKALKNGDISSAEQYYLAAIAIKEKDIDSRLALAKMYKENNLFEKMEDMYKQVLTIKNDTLIAYRDLFEYYNSKKDVESILELRDSAPNNSRILAIFEEYAVSAPRIHKKGGNYSGSVSVMISANMDYEIYYTLDGTDPRKNGILYTKTIAITHAGMTTLKATSKNDKGVFSSVVTETYYLNVEAPDDPYIKVPSGTFDTETYIYLDVPTGCTAYYTWNREDPGNANSNRLTYENGILIPSGTNLLKLVIIDNATGLSNKTMFTGWYTCTLPGIPVPGLPEPDTDSTEVDGTETDTENTETEITETESDDSEITETEQLESEQETTETEPININN